MRFFDTPVRQTELIHLLERYRAEMSSGIPPRDTPSLTILYDLLVRPVAASVANGSQIVVIPDGVLHAVPFAALLRREDRRYLVEDHALEVAPSLTTFIAASRQPFVFDENATALVLGNPRLEGDVADLPQAEAEAKDVAALYRHAQLLLGADATKRAFVRDAGSHAIVHFAGHAIANDRRPELSRLLLASPEETDRSLFARDIAKESFASTRLVVLGACRTSAGRIRRGEGVFSLARPFLAAGVPNVIASLWDVDDHATRRLLVAFHRALRHSTGVTEALRRAQLEVMSDADPALQKPAAWSGFIAIGGSTDSLADSRQ
jgi:CHAT domain-containing protein